MNSKSTGNDKTTRRKSSIELITAIVALVTVIVSLMTAYVEYRAKKQAEADKAMAEQAAAEVNRRNDALTKRNAELYDQSLTAFLGGYERHLEDLNRAVATYRESKEGDPPRNEVINAANGLADFAAKWRLANRNQKALINGPITTLQEGIIAGDIDKIENALRVIQKVAPDLRAILEKDIENLRSK